MSKKTRETWMACDRGDYGDYDGECIVILDADMTRRVAVVFREEDASLVSQAPDLLAMLEHAVHWHDQLTKDDIDRYKAVIAKATNPNTKD